MLPLIWMTAGAMAQAGSSNDSSPIPPLSCVKPPAEVAPSTSSSPRLRRYRIINSCRAGGGRVAVFVICDRRKFDMLFLDAGEERIWSCESGGGYGPGVLSIDVKSVR
jgi:hypothetical protein